MSSSLDCIVNSDYELLAYFRPFAQKMEEHHLPAIVINLFKCYFSQLLFGSQGKLTKSEILPIQEEELPDLRALKEYHSVGVRNLNKFVMFKLNGGLGTSMGLQLPKSLLPVKNEKSFLELTLEQEEYLRAKYNQPIPLIFMNSFYTNEKTISRLEDFNNPDSLPLSFVQNKFPRILKKKFTPVSWPKDPNLEWNPPGHGDFYTALITSGLLDRLLNRGYRYAFVSNCDNLGANLDLSILGYLIKEELSFVMEVTKRTPLDKKGGHLCRLLKNYRLALRELAQCPSNELADFQNIKLYSFFNTNSLWLDLQQIKKVFLRHKIMPLDLIINEKHVDSTDHSSPLVYQLETAMGSAISAFDFAEAVNVPRTRFSPVKTTADLLLIRSNCYQINELSTIELNIPQENLPTIELDPAFYKNYDQFEQRFPYPVKFDHCSSLKVKGDIYFGKNITFNKDVVLINKKSEKVFLENMRIEGERVFE